MDRRVERYRDPDVEASVARVEALSRIMDSMFEIPGTKVRVGVDAIIGLVPVLGDLVSQADLELHHLGGAPARRVALHDRAHDRQHRRSIPSSASSRSRATPST